MTSLSSLRGALAPKQSLEVSEVCHAALAVTSLLSLRGALAPKQSLEVSEVCHAALAVTSLLSLRGALAPKQSQSPKRPTEIATPSARNDRGEEARND